MTEAEDTHCIGYVCGVWAYTSIPAGIKLAKQCQVCTGSTMTATNLSLSACDHTSP